jgi:hypothetical protein
MAADRDLDTAASQAVAYLEEVSPELRGCAIVGGDGEVLAASGDDRSAWRPAAAGLLTAVDAAGGEPASHAHVATGEGEAFAVRFGELAAVAVTDRFGGSAD